MTTYSQRPLIFDCDGVIVDSEIVATRVALRMLRPLGYQVTEAEHTSAYSGLLENEILDRIQRDHGVQLPKDFHPRLIENIIQAMQSELQPIAGMPELLRSLPGPIAVASNSLVVHVERSLGIAGVRDLVGDRIFSSEQVPQAKPAPDVYLLALQTLGYQAADT
ncbi:MAG: HAD hydrolase-like protein, partial [Bacteroidota bacterium]